MNILYFFFAIFSLGLLVFVHELGHFLAAKIVGMKIETFSIGFGKSIAEWEFNGVICKIGWFPLGGYVKIRGQERGNEKNLRNISRGFYSKHPLQRLFVAIMGPMMNVLFALLLFATMWTLGGKHSKFSLQTKKIGYIDPYSDLYKKGVKIGDEILEYNGNKFEKFEDHLTAGLFSSKENIIVKGLHVDYYSGDKIPFEYSVGPCELLLGNEKIMTNSGVIESARYFIYDKDSNNYISRGDRIVWIDGEIIFSNIQMTNAMRKHQALLRIQRGNARLLKRVPLHFIKDLQIDAESKEDLIDRKIALGINGDENSLLYLPFDVNESLNIPYNYGDDNLLQSGDKILSVNGNDVNSLVDLFKELQERKISVIVSRNQNINDDISWENCDDVFDKSINWQHLKDVVDSISNGNPQGLGSLALLQPVTLKEFNYYVFNDAKAKLKQNMQGSLKDIVDPQVKKQIIDDEKKIYEKVIVSISFNDLYVSYNPYPHVLLANIYRQMYKTFSSLVNGKLPVKFISGPVGITHFTYHQWKFGIVNVLFWFGIISTNLAFINLLPVPPLDGGHIIFSLAEFLLNKKLSISLMEKVSFLVMMFFIALLLFITYHDIYRLFTSLFS